LQQINGIHDIIELNEKQWVNIHKKKKLQNVESWRKMANIG